MKRVRNLLIVVAVLAVAVALAAFTSKRGGDAVSVKTIVVKASAFRTKLPETGMVQRPQVVTVPTLVAGNVGKIYVQAGEYVRAGELLATIDNPSLESNAASSQADYDSAVANIRTAKIQEENAKVTYQAQVETAKSNLAEAQRVYDADEALYRSKAIPRNQVDTDKTKLVQAQVQYQQALRQLHLGAVTGYGTNSVQYAQASAQKAQIVNASNQQQLAFTRIVAPFDGIIQTVATQPNDPMRNLHEGDAVTQGQSLFTIASTDAYTVKAQVDEQDIINVHVGQQAEITGEDFPGKTLYGRVVWIAPVAIKSTDPSSTARQVLTTIRLDRSPAFLRDGMNVDVDLLTTDLKKALAVPSTAISRKGKTSYVYVVRRGKAVETDVRTGTANDVETVIKSGLHPGEVVIAQKYPLVHDGSAVTPVPQPSGSPAN